MVGVPWPGPPLAPSVPSGWARSLAPELFLMGGGAAQRFPFNFRLICILISETAPPPHSSAHSPEGPGVENEIQAQERD